MVLKVDVEKSALDEWSYIDLWHHPSPRCINLQRLVFLFDV